MDPNHYDLRNQMDRVTSVTYSRGTNNQPAGGVEAANADHGSHVAGVVSCCIRSVTLIHHQCCRGEMHG
jgi:hypothetical protein